MVEPAQVLPFRGGDNARGLTRLGVSVLAEVWRVALRAGGPIAARDAVRDHARVVAHAMVEAFGPRAADFAELLARALIEEVKGT